MIRETKLNAEKLSILTVLHEEKNLLYTILKSQEQNFEKWMQPHKVNLDRDVEKLTQIHKEQKQTIEVGGSKLHLVFATRIFSLHFSHSAWSARFVRCA